MTKENNNSELVFVDFYMMLGDADGHEHGFAIMERTIWKEEEKALKDYLDELGQDFLEVDTGEYLGELSLKNYKVKPCTREEAETMIKFHGKTHGYQTKVLFESFGWQSPSDFLERM